MSPGDRAADRIFKQLQKDWDRRKRNKKPEMGLDELAQLIQQKVEEDRKRKQSAYVPLEHVGGYRDLPRPVEKPKTRPTPFLKRLWAFLSAGWKRPCDPEVQERLDEESRE